MAMKNAEEKKKKKKKDWLKMARAPWRQEAEAEAELRHFSPKLSIEKWFFFFFLNILMKKKKLPKIT